MTSASSFLMLAEVRGSDLLPLVLIVSGVSIAITGGAAWGLFALAKRLKLKNRRPEGVILALVFAWMFVVASVLCAGCGLLTAASG